MQKDTRIQLENEAEATRFADIMEQEGIPCSIMSYHSSAFDGIFQLQNGWGHAEVPEEYQTAAETLLAAYREAREEK